MVRLKLSVFAALVLGMGLAPVFVSAPSGASTAIAGAKASAAQAVSAVDGWMATRRGQISDLALAVAQKPELTALVAQTRSKAEAPTPATFGQLRELVSAAAPAELKDSLVLGWSNPAGALFAKGADAPAPQLAGVDPALAAPSDAVATIDGVPYRVIALTVAGKEPSTVVIGAPLLTPSVAEDVAKKLGLASVAVISSGQVVAAGGVEKANVGKALEAASKSDGVVSRGAVDSLGPVRFPVMTQGDALGGAAPTEVLARGPLSQHGLEVAAVASTRAALAPLAADQRLTVELFVAGLVLFALSLLWVGGSPKREENEDEEESENAQVEAPRPIAAPPARQGVVTPSVQAAPSAPAAATKKKDALELSEAPSAPEAHPDDFDFGAALQKLPDPEASDSPASSERDSGHSDGADASPFGGGDFDSERTTMYPTSLSGTTQLPAMAEDMAHGEEMANEEHEATRVAAIPNELLQETVRRAEDISIPAPPAEPLPLVAPAMADSEEVHFQEVFQEFLSVRQQCGEGSDSNLTYEKFAAKLRKNREQLSEKYACRTVRFQVYVKEGKAALKATPVKD